MSTSAAAKLALGFMRQSVNDAAACHDQALAVNPDGSYDANSRADALRAYDQYVEVASHWALVVIAERAGYKLFGDLET